MRVFVLVLFVASVTAGFGQESTAAVAALPATPEIIAELRTKLDARTTKPGDPVRLKLFHALLAKGKIVVPEGATLIGHVTEVAIRSEDNPESRIALKIERAEWKHQVVLMDAVVVRQAMLVRNIVIGPAGARATNNREWDRLEAMSRSGGQPVPAAAPAATTQAPSTKSATGTPTQPSPTPAQPNSPAAPAQPTPSAASSGGANPPPSASPGRVGQGSSPAEIERTLEARYESRTIRAEGPHAKHVGVRRSANPQIGNALVSQSRNVVVPKGTLLVLSNSGPK